MKKFLFLALLVASLSEEALPVAAAPSATTTIAKNPDQLSRTRRRLHRQAMQRMRHNKHRH